jgi:hypothetical protein
MGQRIQIVPMIGFRLFGSLVKKEIDLGRKNQGTFFRSGRKAKDKTRWSHKSYAGWLNIERTAGEIVAIEVNTRGKEAADWQLLHAFVGSVARHFADQVEAMHIHFSEPTK